MITRRFVAALVVLIGGGGAAPATPPFGDRSVEQVHTSPGRGHGTGTSGGTSARTRCVGIDHVAGAVVFGDRAVELTMTDHSRWRMNFDTACPALSFYQGFYYRRAVAGRLCAGRDAVIARSGGSCPISSIVRVRR